jgi:hypothetical protein
MAPGGIGYACLELVRSGSCKNLVSHRVREYSQLLKDRGGLSNVY